MIEIILATRSAGKLAEMRALCAALPWHWRGLEEFPSVPDAPENGDTFAANARQKALFYARRTGGLTLADDSGLEVDCLDGAPGVHSAYYAGHPRNDSANNSRLIAALAGVPPQRRTARFRCCMALARLDQIVFETSGTFEGLIIDAPRGGGGFGYDPHFLIPSLQLTSAELSTEHKNAISHRGQALRRMIDLMIERLGA